ncbi:hypothetical protein DUI87_28570 [Hirundo rustica rustica]|uniref:Uncharacterized protein n=1 Tax=Hirundo rustica rustica TaxID=333673 RepID=A0A3M0J1V1_HIRRU|nr:hypothetical protein DUI87_28570 [Hirundo rustica rustica]
MGRGGAAHTRVAPSRHPHPRHGPPPSTARHPRPPHRRRSALSCPSAAAIGASTAADITLIIIIIIFITALGFASLGTTPLIIAIATTLGTGGRRSWPPAVASAKRLLHQPWPVPSGSCTSRGRCQAAPAPAVSILPPAAMSPALCPPGSASLDSLARRRGTPLNARA